MTHLREPDQSQEAEGGQGLGLRWGLWLLNGNSLSLRRWKVLAMTGDARHNVSALVPWAVPFAPSTWGSKRNVMPVSGHVCHHNEENRQRSKEQGSRHCLPEEGEAVKWLNPDVCINVIYVVS